MKKTMTIKREIARLQRLVGEYGGEGLAADLAYGAELALTWVLARQPWTPHQLAEQCRRRRRG